MPGIEQWLHGYLPQIRSQCNGARQQHENCEQIPCRARAMSHVRIVVIQRPRHEALLAQGREC